MITKDEAYDIIQQINENAHQQAWDTWEEADNLMESDDEDDWEAAEELRDQASTEQSNYFKEEFESLDEETQEAIMHYVDTDESFREEFVMWYGEDNFDSDFN